MFYAIYKGIRDGAWLCLLDNNIDRLPVDVLKIARAAGIRVIKNSAVNDLLPDEDAKTYYDGKKFIIIYNDLNDIVVSRFAIAHELGHIFLGHITTHTKFENVREFGKKPKAEQQADMFALRLLCPACILMQMDLRSVEDISSYCRIPHTCAKIRSKRIEELCKRDKFYKSDLEKQVYHNFSEYVYINQKRKDSHGIRNEKNR